MHALRESPEFDGEKENDQKFAKELASLADIYVNEAFSVCHREHASIVSVPKYIPSYAGLELEKEISESFQSLQSCASVPVHPGRSQVRDQDAALAEIHGISPTLVFVGGALGQRFFQGQGL